MAKSKPSETTAAKGKKTECPVTKAQFFEKAKPMLVVLGDEKKVAVPKEFASGSFGYFFNDKVVVEIDGVPVKLQANVLLTVVGSKPSE